MAERVNVRFADELRKFIRNRVAKSGFEERRKWSWLRAELGDGLKANEAEFVPLDAGKIIKEAKAGRAK